jgi:hypothetical protein
MGVLRHRRIRRQEVLPDDDEENDYDDDDYQLSTITSSSIASPSTSTENSYDKAKAIGQEVIKKVPSKYAEKK